MKALMTVLAVVAVCGLVSVGLAGEKGDKPAEAKGIMGKVVKVDGANLVIKVGKEGTEKTILTDASTKVTVGGKEAKLADLQADMHVKVMPDTASDKVAATEIKAMAPKTKPTK